MHLEIRLFHKSINNLKFFFHKSNKDKKYCKQHNHIINSSKIISNCRMFTSLVFSEDFRAIIKWIWWSIKIMIILIAKIQQKVFKKKKRNRLVFFVVDFVNIRYITLHFVYFILSVTPTKNNGHSFLNNIVLKWWKPNLQKCVHPPVRRWHTVI